MPNHTVKQPIPGARVSMEGASTDSMVSLYADMVSLSTSITWSTGNMTNAAYHQDEPSMLSSHGYAIARHAVPVSATGGQSIVADNISIRPQITANNPGTLTLNSDLTGTTKFRLIPSPLTDSARRPGEAVYSRRIPRYASASYSSSSSPQLRPLHIAIVYLSYGILLIHYDTFPLSATVTTFSDMPSVPFSTVSFRSSCTIWLPMGTFVIL
ncbi:hypothetical protein HMN09_00002700 [Mycena chlorophos]|uniref:Uncharacterized protein n=1 Tax=Mycena chlorophos TaxID=658473 RepID=A0A8H6TV13_MYCCL|nr:hypothetical protein HMN09_00002700 [Mycena chlorophos]